MKNIDILKKMKIDVPEKLIKYSKIRRRFLTVAEEKSNSFNDKYYDLFSDMDDLVENGFSKGLEIIKPVIELAVGELVASGFYSINLESFTKKYFSKHFVWEDDFESFLGDYSDICLDEEAAREYREERKANRSREYILTNSGVWAETNDGGELIHSAFNAIGNAMSKAKANEQKEAMFLADATRNALVESIHNTCFSIHFALAEALYDNDSETNISTDELAEGKRTTEILLENLQKELIPESGIVDVVKEIIVKYPFDIDFSKYLLDSDSFTANEVIEFANHISVDIIDVLFSESTSDIKLKMDQYDSEKREKIYSRLEKIGQTNSELDNEIMVLKELCLRYNKKQFSSYTDLQKAMKDDDEKVNKIVNICDKFKSNSSLDTTEIPEKKLINAIDYYDIPDYETILVLIDNTVMGSAKSGIAFCKKGIYIKNPSENSFFFSYSGFEKAKSIKFSTFGVTLIVGGMEEKEYEFDLSASQFSKKDFRDTLNTVIQLFTGEEIGVEVNALGAIGKAVSLFFPWIGLILYLIWRKNEPGKASTAGKYALGGGLFYIILMLLSL